MSNRLQQKNKIEKFTLPFQVNILCFLLFLQMPLFSLMLGFLFDQENRGLKKTILTYAYQLTSEITFGDENS